MLLLCNHKCDLDYFFVWALAARVSPREPGHFTAVAKGSLRKVPLFAWLFKLVGFLFLSRAWETDAAKLRAWAAAQRASRRPQWLTLYPEGTRFTAKAQAKSDAACAAHGLPPLKGELLLPRPKGFTALAQLLLSPAGPYTHVCDMSLCYVGAADRPLSWSQLGTSALLRLGSGKLGLSKVLVHSQLFDAAQLPLEGGEEALRGWLTARWARKEAMLAAAAQTGRFPDDEPHAAAGGATVPRGEEEARAVPAARAALVACVFGAGSVALVALLATSPWFRLYFCTTSVALAGFALWDPIF